MPPNISGAWPCGGEPGGDGPAQRECPRPPGPAAGDGRAWLSTPEAWPGLEQQLLTLKPDLVLAALACRGRKPGLGACTRTKGAVDGRWRQF